MFNKSFHFIPLSNLKFLSKISSIEADCIILDLEDGVSDEEKDIARENLKELSVYKSQLFLRINTECDIQFLKDITLINETKWKNIMLPKVSLKDIEVLNKKIKHSVSLFPLFESINAIYNFEKIISAIEKISYIGLGLEDILSINPYEQNDLEEFIRNINNKLIFKCKAFNLQCIDGVSLDFNKESFESICETSKSFGFNGKMSIHPSQVSTINKIWEIDLTPYTHAKNILNVIGKENHTGYLKYKNEIITPPKIKKYQTIIKYYEKKIQ